MSIIIRPERPEDIPGIRHVNLPAFSTALEADLVDALREQARPLISLVATDGHELAGHIVCSPVTLLTDPNVRIMGLGPMAVEPSRQRLGIGSALVRGGVEECFMPASTFGLASDYDVPQEVFMALELTPAALRQKAGTIRYHPAFPAA